MSNELDVFWYRVISLFWLAACYSSASSSKPVYMCFNALLSDLHSLSADTKSPGIWEENGIILKRRYSLQSFIIISTEF